MYSTIKEKYDRDGFVVVPNLISANERKDLEDACERIIIQTRNGLWTHRRTVGKQFPPYGEDSLDSWGVQHIMHPDLHEPAFLRWYTSDALIHVIIQLLGCTQKDLQMELFNLLINPLSHKFALRWHRDDVKETASNIEEEEALKQWHSGVQWNTALYKDSCLYLVPGSHNTPRSEEQRKHSETLAPPINPLDMPGAIQLTIQPGESVFYNSNILHCATYDPDIRRATLHATMGDARGGSTRARNILQHGLQWMKEPDFIKTLNERGRAMLNKLLQMEMNVGNVGYSLTA